MKKIILTGMVILVCIITKAQQFDIQGDLRFRYENRHGYSTLIADTLKAANFVSQRSRIIFNYSNPYLKLKVSPQVIKVWGDVSSNTKSDLNNAFHEAWAEVMFTKQFSVKAGRQEIAYDDHRIFGNVDWTMQARSHDALLLKWLPANDHQLHFGIAYNANKESNFFENYMVAQYRAFQYVWYHGQWKQAALSFLLLNNGMPYMDSNREHIAYAQTIGPRFTYKAKKLSLESAIYYQAGKMAKSNVNALYAALSTDVQWHKNMRGGIGYEYLSGKSMNDVSTDVRSFNPLYGTNHKFNGYMDYFYVGNHLNSVGLNDLFLNLYFEKNKFSARFNPHYFMSAASMYKNGIAQNAYLGTELDFTLAWKWQEAILFQAGYSQMLGSESLELLRGGNHNNLNQWFYLAMQIQPQIFNYKK